MLKEMSVMDFIDETASSSPAPGGGSIAALTASTSAALISMVANLTIGKKGYEDVQEEMQKVVMDAGRLKDKFLFYMQKDTEAFNKIMEGFKMKKDKEEEKAKRKEFLQEAYKLASLVPFSIGSDAAKLFELSEKVLKNGNKNAVTDGLISVLNANAAIKSAFYNVKINLSSIEDDEFVQNMKKDMKEIEKTAEKYSKELIKKYDI